MGSVKEKGEEEEEEEGACVCSGSFLDLHERPFPPPPPTTPSPRPSSLISTRVSVILGYVRVRGCTGFLASSQEGCLGFQKDGSLC